MTHSKEIIIRLKALLGVSCSLLTPITSKDIINDTLTELESSNVSTNVKSVYNAKPTIRQKDVRDELAIAYEKEIVNVLLSLVCNACSGCKNDVEKNINTQQHDVCTFPRRKRIAMFIDMAVLMVCPVPVQKKVVACLKNQKYFDHI